MKRIVTTAFIIALSFGAAQAQKQEGQAKKEHRQEKGQGQHQRGHHGKGFEQLDLSADQKSRIQTINENYRKQVAELKSQTNISVAEAKSRREALQKQHRADIQAVLTAEQRAKMESQKRDWQAKGKKGEFKRGEGFRKDSTGFGKKGDRADRQGMRGGKDGRQKMQQELNLSADQQAKMAKLREEFKTKSESIRSNSALSQDQKREQIKSLAQQHRDQVKSILTKEQQEKMETVKAKRGAKNTK